MTAGLDLRPEHLAIVHAILRRHVPHCAVWAFGSRVKGTARPYSDLDLAVITERPLGLAISGALAEDFSASDLPFRVDLVDWANTTESFRRIIERERIALLPAVTPGDRDDP